MRYIIEEESRCEKRIWLGRSKKGQIDGKRVFDLYAGSSAGTGLCHGFGILKNIYEGTFDEADLGNEQIPEWYQSKIRLETLSGEFFRDLLLYFIWWMILSIYAIGCFFI